MEVKMIDMDKIATNPLQPRQTFDREKLQELADSIKEGELLQPIVVRAKGTKYEIVCGERRYKAFQILEEPRIPAIIRDIRDDTDALEKSLVENWHRADLTGTERENALADLWESKKYKTHRELAKKLAINESTVSKHLEAKESRKTFGTKVSTTTLTETAGLGEKPRKKLIKQIEEENIPARKVRDVVEKLKEFPEEEQQIEEIDRIVERKKAYDEQEEYESEKDLDIATGKREAEHLVSDDPDEIRLNILQEQCSSILKITPSNIKIIKNEKYQNKALDVLEKTMNHIHKLLIALDRVDVIE